MDLIKKTIILTGKCDGYLSIIKVGDDVGAKIVGENFVQGMAAGIKIGTQDTEFFLLEGQKTEINLISSFRQNDNFGCVIIDNDGLVSRGGNNIKYKEVTEHFAEKTETPLPSPEPKEAADESIGDDIIERLSAKDGAEYYTAVKEKVDELFVIYPKEESLMQIFPDSEWVKINYDGDDYYVVGKIRENDRTVMLCYGVPGKKDVPLPKITEKFSWLEIKNAVYDGYWLLFQDANSGKILDINQNAEP